MSNNKQKSAAVPFFNQKGERSMKRVKVERYVAGKKPSYAKDDNDEEYITDDEYDEEQDRASDQESDRSSQESTPKEDVKPTRDIKIEDDIKPHPKLEIPSDEEDDDDPRFRNLKKIESKPSTSRGISGTQSISRVEESRFVLDEDEDEEEIRRRHTQARARTIEEPLGPQVVFGDVFHSQPGTYDKESGQYRETTDDLLKDFKLTGLVPKEEKSLADQLDERLKEALDRAKEEGMFRAQVEKRIEEDIKADNEKELQNKGNFGTNDMNAVITDDEDEEIAFEEWRVREIQRVLRDRRERALAEKAK